MEHFHYLVWIDHQLARIMSFNEQTSEARTLHSARGAEHLHHKANARDSGHVTVDHDFLEQVAQALQHAGAILITGPAGAKHELATHLKAKHPAIAARVSGVETVDHPSEGQLLALARKFFHGDDRMHAQRRTTP